MAALCRDLDTPISAVSFRRRFVTTDSMSPYRAFRTIRFLFVGVSLLCGAYGAEPAPKEVHDDFEGSKLSDVWDTDRFELGAVEIQSAIAHSGRSAAKITVHQGDKYEGTDPLQSKETERAELLERRDLVGREEEGFAYAFSLFLPKDFPVVPTRLVLAQWKQYDSNHTAKVDNPVVALRYSAGELMLTLQTSPEKKILFRTTEEIRGRWLDFVFHLRFARSGEGLVRAWLNEKPVADVHGVTAYTEQYGYPKTGLFYFMMGLYRDRMP
jgi:hypothetical protein